METRDWAFLSAEHPVYQRPPGDDRWEFGPQQFQAREYRDESGIVREELAQTMIGHPSVTVYQGRGRSTIQQVDLRSDEYATEADISGVLEEANRWLQALRAMSRGPYTRAMLAKLNHPYGYGETTQYRNRPGYVADTNPTWAKLYKPRKIPSMGPFAYIRGVKFRGRVSDRSIINVDSGQFLASWRLDVTRWYGGLTLRFTNTAPWSWFLYHGTIHAQAHGPWGTVAERILPSLQQAWRNAANAVWRQRRAEAAQYPEDDIEAQQREYDAGGFA